MGRKDDDGAAATSQRPDVVLPAVTASLTLCLLHLLYNIRFSIKLNRFPLLLDAERKDDVRGPGLDVWEVLFCSLVPLSAWRWRSRCRNIVRRVMGVKNCPSHLILATVAVVALFWFLFLRKLISPHQCGSGWMGTDVGYIRSRLDIAAMGVSMRTLCAGRVWEPHVARAISDHLYGQGRAVDVGAFVGYHTIRLAKNAAPFKVYAFEGRAGPDLNDNLHRNNAKNVKLVEDTIDVNWKLDPMLEQDLLSDENGPVALVKIDCESCELHFLKGAQSVLKKWHPVLVIEIQDDENRRKARVGGQQIIKPSDTREDVMAFLRDGLGYTDVEPLKDDDGVPTWDYLAYWLPI